MSMDELVKTLKLPMKKDEDKDGERIELSKGGKGVIIPWDLHR